MNVKIVNKSKHTLPKYQTTGSVGMDLTADITSPIELKPGSRVLVPTNIFIQLLDGYEAQIRPRSGLAFKHGITVLNSPGTIDSDYIGEIKVLLINTSDTTFIINDGERIAQMVINKCEKITWNEVETLEETDRGAGGFGHTGLK